ncbi:hypothetical protein GJ496_000591 [Pomphorhynchus laevis]|nr:hypothetical protein GJ496_000591 [Pomphorhynchus laevis]
MIDLWAGDTMTQQQICNLRIWKRKKQRRLLVLAWGKLARAGVSLRKYRHQWVFQAHENYMSYLQMDVLCTAKCTSEQLPDHR